MTRQEALELLNKFEFCCDFSQCTNDWECDECCEALNMAIKALEYDPCVDCPWKRQGMDAIYNLMKME